MEKKLVLHATPVTKKQPLVRWTKYSKSPHIRTCLRARLKKVLISKALRLIARYRDSYLKGALCRPFESLTKMSSPTIYFGIVLMDPITNLGGKVKLLKANWDQNELINNNQKSTLLPLQ